MKAITVCIRELEPMRAACVRAVSTTPEMDSWNKLKVWAQTKGLLNDPGTHPVFGYTFQRPEEGKSEYGYEFWIKIDSKTVIEGGILEHFFEGGLYAVTTHEGPPEPEIWKRLWDWVLDSPYQWRKTHELEQPHNPLAKPANMTFDLYLPIEERRKTP